MTKRALERLAEHLTLGGVLGTLRDDHGGYDLLDHRKQGEFHHDVLVRVTLRGGLEGDVLLVSTNCNGGVKQVACFADVPTHDALWHERCPDNEEFQAEVLPTRFGEVRTVHWFDPCGLLLDDARSELKEEHRARQRGGGWKMR